MTDDKMSFAKQVREARTLKYETVTQFHKVAKLSCSRFYYQKIENGTIPKIDLALEVIRALKLELRAALFAWCRDQMPDAEASNVFYEIGEASQQDKPKFDINDTLKVNLPQAALLSRDPVYWEILLYLSCHYGERKSPSWKVSELAKGFKMSVEAMKTRLESLFQVGLVTKDERNQGYVSPEWYYIPYQKEFDRLRDQNFERAYRQFGELANPDKFRTTITCLLTPEQQKEVVSKVLALTNEIIRIYEEDSPRGKVPFTVGIFASKRRFGNE